MQFKRKLAGIILLTATATSLLHAQGGRRGAAAQPAAPTPTAPAGRGGRGANDFFAFDTTASTAAVPGDAQPVETHQKIALGSDSLAYTARAGFLPLLNPTTGQSEAHLFFTYYAKDGTGDMPRRPLVVFVGGAPGVASAWQEFGGLGPKRMKAVTDTADAPYGWADNSHTLLADADLVFVNPVGTGFSRPDQPAFGPNFWNTTADAASLGEFTRSFVRRYNRSLSPLFIAGEDLSTARASGIAAYLVDHQVPVRGVILLSTSLSADAIAGDAQFLTLIPSLTMAAWHHKKLSPELNAMSAEQIAGQARQFASREYLHALYKSDRMTADERTKAIANLARLTGLSKAFLTANDLRPTLERFNSELLREQRRGLAYSDARISAFVPMSPAAGRGGGRAAIAAPAPPPLDVNLATLSGPFLTAYEGYLRRELNFTGNNGIYYLMSGGVSGFTSTGSDDTNLANAFARNPGLHAFIGVNYFDLNAPFYATEFTLAHLNVSPEVRAHNISVSHYEAGQMAYADEKALVKLHRDLAAFVTEAISAHKSGGLQ